MLIIGAGGFAKQVLDSLHQDGLTDNIAFFDDTSKAESSLFGFKVLNSTEAAQDYFNAGHSEFILGTSTPKTRRDLAVKFEQLGGRLTNHISKLAHISIFNCKIEPGTIILPKSYVEPNAQIGLGVLINYNCFVAHDCSIGNFSEISPGVKLLGNSSIGAQTFIGSNTVVLPGITVGNHCKIGAGAVVTHDLPDGVTAVGVPAGY